MKIDPPLYIVSAKRTPFGRFLGGLARTSPVELAVAAAEEALAGIDREQIDLCLFGNVLGAGQGMNISRQIGLRLGLPTETPALTVNQMCASGLTSVLQAVAALRSGEARAVLCGGTESMSQAPHLLPKSRSGQKFGEMRLIDSVLLDGLTDPSSGQHMGLTAEGLAASHRISREAQDEFAWQSHQKWAAAEKRGDFSAERMVMKPCATDEQARPDSAPEKLAALAPVFQSDGTVTAANASGLNDGAAALVVADAATCSEHGWNPLTRITGWATVGCDPQVMGLGPVHAIGKLCARFEKALENFETVEINEAFAAQVLACVQELELDPAQLNPQGGAIAIGHPIGASGARLATHLAHRIGSGQINSGLASLCVGGGMGIALALEKT